MGTGWLDLLDKGTSFHSHLRQVAWLMMETGEHQDGGLLHHDDIVELNVGGTRMSCKR